MACVGIAALCGRLNFGFAADSLFLWFFFSLSSLSSLSCLTLNLVLRRLRGTAALHDVLGAGAAHV